MPVEPGAPNRHEQVARAGDAAVDDNLTDLAVLVDGGQRPTDRTRDPAERQSNLGHPARDFTRRASSPSRATATSSNGSVRPAIS